MKKIYRHLFFDLDRTLWDFDRNSEITLQQIFREYELQQFFGSFVLFKERFHYHNQKLWAVYYQNGIKKEVLSYRRFYLCLKEAGKNDVRLSKRLAQTFIELSPLQTKTFPETHETLDYLQEKGYLLHIITNGFNEVQGRKLHNCKLAPYFTNVITSEDAGCNKPHPDIFTYALKRTGATPEESLMIGDDLHTDILGARNIGMDQVYFNPERLNSREKTASYEIYNLAELRNFL